MKALGLRSLLMGAGVLLGLSGAAASASDTMTPAYQWKKDTKLFYRWTETTDVTMSSDAGMTSKTQNGRISTVTWAVQDVDATGVAKIKMTYNASALTTQLPKATDIMKWDSLSPATTDATSPLAMIFSNVVGESITFTVDGRGNVGKVEGVTELGKKLRQAAVDTPGGGTFVNGIQAVYTESQMKTNLERVLSGNPEKPVKVGDTWADEFTLPNAQLGSFKLARMHTLESTDAVKAKVTTDIKVSLNQPKDGDPAKGMFDMMRPELKTGEGKGSRLLNLEKGCPEESKVTLNIDFSMSGAGMKMSNATVMMFLLERLEQLPPGAMIPGETPPPAPAPTVPPKPAQPPAGDLNLTPTPKK